MTVSITEFRKQMFTLVNQAMAGTEVWVTHKGKRFRIVPEKKPPSKLSRLTPLDLINEDVPESVSKDLFKEMQRLWEEEWKDI